MNKANLAQPIALMIENCRASGISDEVLIQSFKTRDFSPLQHIEEGNIDFEKWLNTAEEIGNDWERAISHGYEFSFITINGIKKLLASKFKKHIDQDYKQEGDSIHGLKMKAVDVETLRTFISRQWEIVIVGEDVENKLVIARVELKYQLDDQ